MYAQDEGNFLLRTRGKKSGSNAGKINRDRKIQKRRQKNKRESTAIASGIRKCPAWAWAKMWRLRRAKGCWTINYLACRISPIKKSPTIRKIHKFLSLKTEGNTRRMFKSRKNQRKLFCRKYGPKMLSRAKNF